MENMFSKTTPIILAIIIVSIGSQGFKRQRNGIDDSIRMTVIITIRLLLPLSNPSSEFIKMVKPMAMTLWYAILLRPTSNKRLKGSLSFLTLFMLSKTIVTMQCHVTRFAAMKACPHRRTSQRDIGGCNCRSSRTIFSLLLIFLLLFLLKKVIGTLQFYSRLVIVSNGAIGMLRLILPWDGHAAHTVMGLSLCCAKCMQLTSTPEFAEV
jgi:hypothetical protein